MEEVSPSVSVSKRSFTFCICFQAGKCCRTCLIGRLSLLQLSLWTSLVVRWCLLTKSLSSPSRLTVSSGSSPAAEMVVLLCHDLDMKGCHPRVYCPIEDVLAS
jgi:hypothetical protein